MSNNNRAVEPINLSSLHPLNMFYSTPKQLQVPVSKDQKEVRRTDTSKVGK